MTFLNMKDLETDRLVLRKISKKDAPDMYEYAQNPEVSKYLTWYAHESLSYTKRYIRFLKSKYRSGEYFDWGIELKDTGKFIGTCGFSVFDPDNKKAEIGYVLNPEYCNKGYATEAVSKVIKYAFSELHLHRIEARIIKENTVSASVAQKCGLRLEGTAVDELFLKGEYKTILHYALIK
jgi:ribosomal-protein-alanine N-acetyltransferase